MTGAAPHPACPPYSRLRLTPRRNRTPPPRARRTRRPRARRGRGGCQRRRMQLQMRPPTRRVRRTAARTAAGRPPPRGWPAGPATPPPPRPHTGRRRAGCGTVQGQRPDGGVAAAGAARRRRGRRRRRRRRLRRRGRGGKGGGWGGWRRAAGLRGRCGVVEHVAPSLRATPRREHPRPPLLVVRVQLGFARSVGARELDQRVRLAALGKGEEGRVSHHKRRHAATPAPSVWRD